MVAYLIIFGFVCFLIGINFVLMFINKHHYEEIKKIEKRVNHKSFLDMMTPPQAGQEIGDDYFNNADLPNKKN